jgi:hypothetical protein
MSIEYVDIIGFFRHNKVGRTATNCPRNTNLREEHLAELYGVKTGQLTRQMRRNLERFPSDFMFQLKKEEFAILRSQSGSSNWGGRRYPPYAYTERYRLTLKYQLIIIPLHNI